MSDKMGAGEIVIAVLGVAAVGVGAYLVFHKAGTTGPKGHLALPIEVNYASEYRNQGLPVTLHSTGSTLEFVYGIQNDSLNTFDLGSTIVLTRPDGTSETITSNQYTLASGKGTTVKVTTPDNIDSDGNYSVIVRLWYDVDDDKHLLDHTSATFSVSHKAGGAAPNGAITGLEIEHSGIINTLPASIPAGGTAKIHTLAVNSGDQTQAKASVMITNPSGAVYGPYVDQDAYASTGEALDITSKNTFPISTPGTYHVNVEFYLGGIQVDSAYNTFTVGSGSGAALTASWANGRVSFSFAGFQHNAQVRIYAESVDNFVNVTSDSNGAGSGSIADSSMQGTYTLTASDGYSNIAQTEYIITPPPVILTASFSRSNGLGVVNYSFSGFTPNITLTLYVVGGGYVPNIKADSNGVGSGSFYDTDPPGKYELIAQDSSGYALSTFFTVT